jgi:hypothetical protein
VRRRANLGALAGALVLLGALAILLGLPDRGSAILLNLGGGTNLPGSAIKLDQSPKSALVLRTPVYRLTLSKQNGGMVSLVDTGSGIKLVTATNGCEWGAAAVGTAAYSGGCAFTPVGSSKFSYSWNARTTTLTMTYTAGADGQQHVDAVVTLHAQPGYFDEQLQLTNHAPQTIQSVNFPVDLFGDGNTVQAGYAPNFLPGVRFGPTFFQRQQNDVFTYPGRWAFADYLALDVGTAHLAMYSVNPPPSPIAPIDLGFVHSSGGPCSGQAFCVTHDFHTWIGQNGTWTSPVVRLRVGESADKTIVDYRTDNAIDAYPSVATKLGSRLDTLSHAPMIKFDMQKGAPPFSQWAGALQKLPSPALIHPVAFGPGGFDKTDPDVLPPDPSVGSLDDLEHAFGTAHSDGDLVMPYLNVSWWSPQSQTVQDLPGGLTAKSVSVQDSGGSPASENFNDVDGLIVSPSVPYVRERVNDEIASWQTDGNPDCLFFDQIGARPWRYDFNPAATSPLDYYDGWLSLFEPFQNRCLMVEDGWDRLGASFSGLDSSLMLMQREFDWLDQRFGTDWTPYPLALWLLHDKVLFYQHDLFDGTFTADPEILTWNLAYGYMLSYNWATGTDSPWLGIVTAFQRVLGPLYAGAPLTAYAVLADGVTQTTFGNYSVIANTTKSPYAADSFTIAPGGFLARTADGSVVAGEFADPSGRTYRIVQNGQTTFQVAVPAPG